MSLMHFENRISGNWITSADEPWIKDKRCGGRAKTTCRNGEREREFDSPRRFLSKGLKIRCPAVPVHPKAAVASCIAMPSFAYNGTPAQPQPHFFEITQWGQLGEILGGVRFPERGASRGPVLPPKPGGVVSNAGSNKTLTGKSEFQKRWEPFH